MNETANLERGYRRVLRCYPKAFRQESGPEILGVLLATAAEGQRRIGLAESAALIRGIQRLLPPARPYAAGSGGRVTRPATGPGSSGHPGWSAAGAESGWAGGSGPSGR